MTFSFRVKTAYYPDFVSYHSRNAPVVFNVIQHVGPELGAEFELCFRFAFRSLSFPPDRAKSLEL